LTSYSPLGRRKKGGKEGGRGQRVTALLLPARRPSLLSRGETDQGGEEEEDAEEEGASWREGGREGGRGMVVVAGSPVQQVLLRTRALARFLRLVLYRFLPLFLPYQRVLGLPAMVKEVVEEGMEGGISR